MTRQIFSSLMLLLTILLLPLTAFADTTSREGAAIFTPPPGWTRQPQSSPARFAPADNHGYFIITPSEPLTTLDATADALLTQSKTLPDFRAEAPRRSGKHTTTGGQWLTFTYTFADPARPGQFNYVWVGLVGAGGRSLALVAVFKDAKSINQSIPAVAKTFETLQLTTTQVLEEGKPPLTRFALDETVDFLEWLVQSPLTDSQKSNLESELRGYWKKNVRDEIDGITQLLDARDKLAVMKPDERELARQAILDPAIAEWRPDKTSPTAKVMVEIYDSSHKPLIPGDPPLTRQAVDAFAEFICFAAGQTVNVNFTPPTELKSTFAAEIAANYAKFPDDQRKLIAQMPLLWAAIRVAWPDLPDNEKRTYIEGWAKDPGLTQLATAIKSAATPATPSTPAAGAPADAAAMMQSKTNSYRAMSGLLNSQATNTIQMMNSFNNSMNASRYNYRWR